MPNGTPEALSFQSTTPATIAASESVVVVPSNQGKAPGIVLGYIDGSGDFIEVGDVDGIPVQGDTTITGVTATSATTTTVNDTNSSTTLLASNTSRIGWAITNTSSAVLYVKFGSTASSTSFAKRLVQYADCGQGPLDGLYTGIITGIWATDPGDGVAVITEW